MAERLEEDLRTLLASSSALVAACPTIAWDLRPQGDSLPAISLWVPSEVRNYAYSGEVDLIQTRVQCDIWAATKPDALRVERLLVPLVSGYRGTVGSTEFSSILLDGRRAIPDSLADGMVVFNIQRDLRVSHKGA